MPNRATPNWMSLMYEPGMPEAISASVGLGSTVSVGAGVMSWDWLGFSTLFVVAHPAKATANAIDVQRTKSFFISTPPNVSKLDTLLIFCPQFDHFSNHPDGQLFNVLRAIKLHFVDRVRWN